MTKAIDDRGRLASLYDRLVGDPPTRREAGYLAALFGLLTLLAAAGVFGESYSPIPVAALVATGATTTVLVTGAVAPTERLPIARETAIGLGVLGAAGCLCGFGVMLALWPDHTWYQAVTMVGWGLYLVGKSREAFGAADGTADAAGGWA